MEEDTFSLGEEDTFSLGDEIPFLMEEVPPPKGRGTSSLRKKRCACLEPEPELEPVGEDVCGLNLVLVQQNHLVVAAEKTTLGPTGS